MLEQLPPETVFSEKSSAQQLADRLEKITTQMEQELTEKAGKVFPRQMLFSDMDILKQDEPELYHRFMAMRKMRRDAIKFARGERSRRGDITCLQHNKGEEGAPIDGDAGIVPPVVMNAVLELLKVTPSTVDGLLQGPYAVVQYRELPGYAIPTELCSVSQVSTDINGLAIDLILSSTDLPSGIKEQHYDLRIVPSQPADAS